MRKYLALILSAFLLASLLIIGGCGKKETPPAAETTQSTAANGQQQPTDQPAGDQTTQQAAPATDKPAAGDDTAKDASKTEVPKPAAPEKTPFEKYLETLPGKLDPAAVAGKEIHYQFNITDGHPGRYFVSIKDGKCTTGKGNVANPTLTINVGEQLWLDMRSDKVNGTTAYLTKKFTVEGDTGPLSNMRKYFPAKN